MKIPEIIEKNRRAIIMVEVVMPAENNQTKLSVRELVL